METFMASPCRAGQQVEQVTSRGWISTRPSILRKVPWLQLVSTAVPSWPGLLTDELQAALQARAADLRIGANVRTARPLAVPRAPSRRWREARRADRAPPRAAGAPSRPCLRPYTRRSFPDRRAQQP